MSETTLSPERYRAIKAAYLEVRDLDPGQRDRWREQHPDPALVAAVERMLQAEAAAGDTLKPAVENTLANLGADRGWKVRGEIGRGGMGVVYQVEREQDGFRMDGALKHFARWQADADAVRRLEAERRILAELNHPHIARLLDGGRAPDGSPYLVMERIDGVSIDRYCHDHALDPDAILRLVRDVADAVAHAHSRFIVHRDLKPANLLVDRTGQVKLLDFGIAKPLTEGYGVETRAGESPLTPNYAAPEQLRGAPVTVATDVYALGVVLYELLAGTSPYGDTQHDLAELVQQVCEAPRVAPSVRAPPRLARALRGDLDAICLKALRPEPEQRYPSMEALREDLERWLAGEPVRARRGTVGYRAGKFVRRHWLLLAAALLLVVVSGGFLLRLRAELAATEVERDSARAVSGFLVDLFNAADPNQRLGADARLSDVLAAGTAKLDRNPDLPPEARARLEKTVGGVYAAISDFRQAESHLRRAIELYAGLPDAPIDDRIDALIGLAETYAAQARLPEATALADQALALPGFERADVRVQARLLRGLADYRRRQNQPVPTAAAFASARRLLESRPELAGELGQLLIYEGEFQRQQGELVAARATLERAAQLVDRHLPSPHAEIAHVQKTLGDVDYEEQRYADALVHHRRALAMLRDLFGENSATIALTWNGIGNDAAGICDVAVARDAFAQAIAVERRVMPDGSANLATMQFNLAHLEATGGQPADAAAPANAARGWRQAHQPAEHPQRIAAEALASYVDCATGGDTRADLDAATARLAKTAASRQRDLLAAYVEAWRLSCRVRHEPMPAAALDDADAALRARVGPESCAYRNLRRAAAR